MNKLLSELKGKLHEFVDNLDSTEYEYLSREFTKKLEKLAASGTVYLGNDFDLQGVALQIRVEELFRGIGMLAEKGRNGREDLVIRENESIGCLVPLVVEVKSSKSQFAEIKHLRQLDDYVYDLSEEKDIRYNGLDKWNTPINRIVGMSIGAMQSPRIHRKRYKGVFVFNGSKGQEFHNRSDIWLAENQVEFAKDRHFCCMTLETLITWTNACQKNEISERRFWEAIYKTKGVLTKYNGD